MKVGVLGASGYVGGELLRLLLSHPRAEVTVATSRRYAGEFVYRVHPNLRGVSDLKFVPETDGAVAEPCELVFTAVPHGAAVRVVPHLMAAGVRVIDLSADFRLKNPQDYENWYGWQHPRPELLSQFVYGVPELRREELRQTRLVACPGCMAVTALLPLAPLARAGVLDLDHIVVDAKTGSSGAGVKPTIATHHAQRSGVVRAYKPVGHRHTAEIEQELGVASGRRVHVSMSPHAVNMVRGILCTIHTFMTASMSVPELWRLFRGAYGSEPFIRFVRDKKGLYRFPDPKILVGSNYCDIGFEVDERNQRLVLISATDNLMKGAAGSAVQCMNVMMGYPERMGLELPGLHPV